MFLNRLVLDLLALGLLLLALAYDWLGNLAHEIIGIAMFFLLASHNVFNRRWYGALANRKRDGLTLFTRAVNLTLLATVVTLLLTSVLISHSVFGFLPVHNTFTARQVHSTSAYLAFLLASVHLGFGWHWFIKVARAKLGIRSESNLRTYCLRGGTVIIAAHGVSSFSIVGVPDKLMMRVTMDFWEFETEALVFLAHHFAIVCLGGSAGHYCKRLLSRRAHVQDAR
ncbi:DUF4405 domain-containing protein [Sinorhizobium sp. A49]|uniref:DUF4405 domain-containing protein n=1 Tax=Sinorhizobium sp. A49 TaxID=1945861 RepID=UPI001FDAA423|nr:DUF4405 domain-containing protein [Sinorhizobium sp. A49]